MDTAAAPSPAPGKIVVHGPNEASKVVPLNSGRISLGRTAANDLCYPDDIGLSRQHLVIERQDAGLVVTDLGSKYGTELNGLRLTGSSVLRPGDRIKAGRVTIEYLAGDAKTVSHTVVFVDSGFGSTENGTVIATNLEAVLESPRTEGASGGSQTVSDAWPVVEALIRAGQELAAHRPLSELFPLILDLSLQAVRATRGALLTSTGGELVVQAAHGENFQISSAVRDRVLNEKTSLLVVDALADSDFAMRNSIVRQSVRSMIAAPLQTGDEVIGLLYVDLTNVSRFFSRDDLNLLTVMANIAAIRIRHAHLIELEAADRVHARELEQAAEIQKKLLPRDPPQFAGLALAGYNLQCKTVGGDYFDYLPFGQGKLAVAVGDVAGKGMPAALLMASLQAHVQAITELGGSPAGVVARLNRSIGLRCPDNRFVTFFLAVFDPAASELAYSNAGHNPPLLLRMDGRVERLEAGGVALGMFARASFEEATIPFAAGDILILYSDGVVEASRAEDDEQFGEDRLVEIVRSSASGGLLQAIERVLEELRAWSGPDGFDDDITLVLARRSA